MKRYHAILLLLVLLSAKIATPVLAAEVCTLKETELACRDAVRVSIAKRFGLDPDDLESRAAKSDDTLVNEVANDKAVEAFRRLIERNTGIKSEGFPSSVLDFLSLFGIDVDSGGLGDDQESLALELNRFLGLPVDDGYQLRILLRQAELYAPLAEKIPEGSRADRKAAIEKGLDDFDNPAVVFTYSPMTLSLGRNPEIHAAYFADLFEAVKRRIEGFSARFSELSNSQAELIGSLTEDILGRLDRATEETEKQRLEKMLTSIEDQDYTFESIQELNEDLATRLLAATEDRWSAWYVRVAMLDKVLAATRFFSFADLVDNQPQLYANVEATARDELVGPNEVKVKVTYEHGFVNVNKLRRHTKDCEASDAEVDVLSCYQLYLTPEKLAQLKRGDRLAVSIEVSDVKDYSPTLPDDGISLDIPGDRKFVGSLVYGRYLDFTEAGRGQSRVDFSWSYENVGDDPNRKDRSLLTLTYSQRVAGDVILAAGVTWANEPEFRGEVNHEISARVGLTYKLFKDDKF